MTILPLILLYGLILSALFSAVLLAMVRVNPRLMLQDYPKDIQAAVPPKTTAEKRQTLYWGLPFLGLSAGFSHTGGFLRQSIWRRLSWDLPGRFWGELPGESR